MAVFPQILVNSVSANRPAVLYEKVTVSEGGSPLLRDMLFSPDQQHIYMLTDKQVSALLDTHTQNGSLCEAETNDTESHSYKHMRVRKGRLNVAAVSLRM